ncbi:Homogentisate 1,2-dioxygenase [Trametes pubescens]|uniref:homogentisate 1,2-dioxygenase n=1 Tax=Trametes pubescens TaxID=154538 RepID=A0A1M2VXU3_TRAPU|nr:Homogentisate 1,2-dioxygenase [Trametes pubescens]
MTTSTFGASASGAFSISPKEGDPYQYQAGFGNRFASEAIPGVLPYGQNMPQKMKYDLYTEGINGTPFVTPRRDNQSTWIYRIRPSVAHQGFSPLPDNPDLESCFFPLNPKVHFSPTQLAWHPFDIPSDNTKVDFVAGLKTLAGNGDPTLREGLAVHIYAANQSMGNSAFCNNDGDFLILPQQGRLDIQTEFGKLMVRPGELVVIQRGIKYKVGLPDGPSRGYILEIFGSHFELPDLGPLGSHGLANTRDFESPVASFDLDQSPWDIAYKVGGKFFACHQEHTPFDVVAWAGNYVPYKYAMEKFAHVGSINKDHIDPSIFTVLTAPSKTPGAPLADFAIFSERWDVASNTFRPPYYHRNCASEMMGLIYGGYSGRSDGFTPGAFSYENGFCPHGVSYDEFKKATEAELVPQKIHVGTLAFMFESSMQILLTDYAMKKSGKLHEHEPKMWDNLKGQFINHLDEVNADLKAAGRPPLGSMA